MKIIKSPGQMKEWAAEQLGSGSRIALVPTMGFFHDGHLSLMRLAAEHGDKVVVSLFVNPIQFGPAEDLARYPRDLDNDTRLANRAKVAVLFAPHPEDMYPCPPKTRVTVSELTAGLCGAARPGHFDGVCTVVAKLFNIVKPSAAVFGSKDFQQLAVIRRMVADLNFDVEIIAHPIVREIDGLAMSSRNIYLTPAERLKALVLSQAIGTARKMAAAGEQDVKMILAEIEKLIKSRDNLNIEYVAVVNRDDLSSQSVVDKDSLLAMAVRIGKTRLIDNSMLL